MPDVRDDKLTSEGANFSTGAWFLLVYCHLSLRRKEKIFLVLGRLTKKESALLHHGLSGIKLGHLLTHNVLG